MSCKVPRLRNERDSGSITSALTLHVGRELRSDTARTQTSTPVATGATRAAKDVQCC
jgi:hypothetical protein